MTDKQMPQMTARASEARKVPSRAAIAVQKAPGRNRGGTLVGCHRYELENRCCVRTQSRHHGVESSYASRQRSGQILTLDF